jgi:hypothetical protein
MHDEDASDRATKGIVTTYAVALPEGAVSLTIRHRSVTVEVRRRARAACLACPRRPSSPWPVECSGGGAPGRQNASLTSLCVPSPRRQSYSG